MIEKGYCKFSTHISEMSDQNREILFVLLFICFIIIAQKWIHKWTSTFEFFYNSSVSVESRQNIACI